ncbi:PREDICTED: probable RNA methyltransferase At5g51130 [Ipomoea nil]|uniref:probable RNA methyltransferase At5g51130 n=1 Tax=Ipomoea nil TaxID=35883 RepID=UPI000901BAA6|nr:PREDICTED: probable RNA methyltransferase At5g51130 [Ipomoea nil]
MAQVEHLETMWEEEKKDNCNGEEQNPVNTNKRKYKEVAVFGNYRNYYGYRIGLDEDPRLKAMKKEWFEGKNCLDIGCNSGAVTIAIAQKFCCRSILGIDIDSDRVTDSYWHLKKVERAHERLLLKTSKQVDSKRLNGLEGHLAESLNGRTRDDSEESHASGRRDLSDIVSFKKANFIKHWNTPEDVPFDTIICLSVSKWVQLNWGDEGLITLFVKAWRLLRPGGVFILEPQPWNSYHKNRLVSETTRINYQNIKIHPEDFQDVLLDKIGFRRVEDITSNASGQKSGFQRPIFAFWK